MINALYLGYTDVVQPLNMERARKIALVAGIPTAAIVVVLGNPVIGHAVLQALPLPDSMELLLAFPAGHSAAVPEVGLISGSTLSEGPGPAGMVAILVACALIPLISAMLIFGGVRSLAPRLAAARLVPAVILIATGSVAAAGLVAGAIVGVERAVRVDWDLYDYVLVTIGRGGMFTLICGILSGLAGAAAHRSARPSLEQDTLARPTPSGQAVAIAAAPAVAMGLLALVLGNPLTLERLVRATLNAGWEGRDRFAMVRVLAFPASGHVTGSPMISWLGSLSAIGVMVIAFAVVVFAAAHALDSRFGTAGAFLIGWGGLVVAGSAAGLVSGLVAAVGRPEALSRTLSQLADGAVHGIWFGWLAGLAVLAVQTRRPTPPIGLSDQVASV